MVLTTAWDLLAYPRLCGLIAKRPSRLSQAMHNAGFQNLGLPFCYVSFDITNTAAAFQALRDLGIRGLSLTIPHKETGLHLVDELGTEAKRIGAVNTIINSGKKLYGFNTDWIGICTALAEAKCHVPKSTVIISGAGGAARAAVFALKHLGAGRIIVCNRTESRAHELAADFGVESCAFSALRLDFAEGLGLVVNATPLGSSLAAGDDPLLQFLKTNAHLQPTVFDMVTRETPLLAYARKAGLNFIYGARMLLGQALEQFRLFTEQEPPKAAMDAALQAELHNS